MGDRIDKILKDSLKEQPTIPKELPNRILKTIDEQYFKTDKIDKILKDSLDEKIEVPKELPNRILKTINENCFKETKNSKHKKNILYKFATGICACILITTTAVFAGELISSIFRLSEEQYGQKQLQKAIEENYIQANNSGEYMKSDNGILYKFNNVLINDINLIISLEFVLEDDLENYQGISINGLEITDENNNQILGNTSNANQDFWLKNIATLMQTITIEKKQNKIEETILLIGHNFPVSKKIYLKFDTITLYSIENGTATTKVINGNYNIELEVDKKFSNREITEYEIPNVSNNKITIKEAKLTNTGLGIVMNAPQIEGLGYKCKLYDENNNEIYSKQNDIGNFNTLETYFIWLDVDNNFKQNKVFKLEITDMEENKYLYEITKK